MGEHPVEQVAAIHDHYQAKAESRAAGLESKLAAAIAAKDAERGRPLTDAEKLANLQRWLNSEDQA